MRTLILPAVATLFVVSAMLYQASSSEPQLAEAPPVRLGEIAGFESEVRPVSEAERTVLPADTGFVKRLYRDAAGNWFQVAVVIGSASKSSVHRPELCLPAQGFQMSAPRAAEIADVPWHLVTLSRGAAAPMGFAYTFFNQDGFRTASHFSRVFRDVWDRSVLGRVDRWVMVTVFASTEDEVALSGFLRQLKEAMR